MPSDLCGALHCDFVMKTKSPKTKCNPAEISRNRNLCEVVFDCSDLPALLK